MPKRILLIGKSGQVGSELFKLLSVSHELLAPGRDGFDIESPDSYAALLNDFRPDVVINTAAFHKVIECEAKSADAFRINVVAQRDLAEHCERIGAQLVIFSTDYVFDGKKGSPYLEDDKTGPLQIYGITRLAGEHIVRAVHPQGAFVIRTCGVYGFGTSQSKGTNFIDQRLKEFATDGTLEMSGEQIVSPSFAGHIAAALAKLLVHPQAKPGIYHLANEGACSWAELAQYVADVSGAKVEVKPVDRGARSGKMLRPRFSALANTRAKALGIELPNWRQGVEDYLNAKKVK